jgi:hypothetical protein
MVLVDVILGVRCVTRTPGELRLVRVHVVGVLHDIMEQEFFRHLGVFANDTREDS